MEPKRSQKGDRKDRKETGGRQEGDRKETGRMQRRFKRRGTGDLLSER